eukprot:scaffold5074_cov99-Cylindrotheca_fusiformis.AAC.3
MADEQTVAVQHARITAFVSHLLSAVADFVAVEDDDAIPRLKSNFQRRLHWVEFVSRNKDSPFFRRHLRMSYDSFCILKDRIKDHFPCEHNVMGSLRGGNISAELHLYATIRYLAGGSYSDICLFCGISVPSFYCIVWRTIRAINSTIEVCFPSTAEHCAGLAAEFESISYDGVIRNCVGALDGYLVSIATPSKNEANNVRSYFSGHYQKYGVNIQACCDAYCRFLFVGVGGPGVTSDRKGIHESGLFALVEKLPPGYVVIGDCAYQPTEHLVPIFGGDLALKKDNDNFNYFASQLRIRIEMAFGMMTRKWGILQRPLTNSLSGIKDLICCIARLHNFCIDERLRENNNCAAADLRTTDSLSINQLAYMHYASQSEHRDILSYEYPQWSLVREELVKRVKERRLERPFNNRRKRKKSTL